MRNFNTPGTRREWMIASFLILTISALSYLLLAQRFGFYGDDWYLVYAGNAEGSGKFVDIFASDRPFRAPFVGAVFSLFSLKAPLYSYLSYVLRAAGALGMFWLLGQVWPRQKKFAVLLALMFAVYPGWTDQPAAFDYQSHLLSFALMVFSLGLSVKSMLAPAPTRKVLFAILAVGTQITALLLMEYYIGIEGMRLVLIAYLAAGRDWRKVLRSIPFSWLKRVLAAWLPYLGGMAGFLTWRVFIFTNSREATDIGGMFSGLIADSRRGLWAALNLLLDYVNIVFMAWFVPVYQKAFNSDLRTTLLSIGIACLSASIVWLTYTRFLRSSAPEESPDECGDGMDMFIVGSLSVLFSIVPIVLGERHIVFPSFSRFTLPGSPGAVAVLGGLLIAFTREKFRTMFPVFLISLAVMFHYSNSAQYARDWEVMRDFWWQASWRAPQIESGTVLAAEYPGVGIAEDYFVWGPANLIYYPDRNQRAGKTYTPLGAVVLTEETVLDITRGREQLDRERRSIYTPQSLNKVLVMTKPTEGSCLSLVDGNAAELSERVSDRTFRISSASKIDTVLTSSTLHVPPAALFGPEPAHGWCYYYQKASLARQRGDWEEVARLGDEVIPQNPRPAEWVEWMPFAQAYAYLGRYEEVDRIASLYDGVPFLRDQACHLFREDFYSSGKKFPEGQSYLADQFCN